MVSMFTHVPRGVLADSLLSCYLLSDIICSLQQDAMQALRGQDQACTEQEADHGRTHFLTDMSFLLLCCATV